MESKHPKLIKALLISAAITGLIVSLIILIIILTFGSFLHRNADLTIRSVDSMLTTTDAGLEIIENTLLNAQDSLKLLINSLEDMSDSLEELEPILTTTSDFFANDFYTLITSAQTSLDSAASSAKLIDNTLSFLSSIPFVNLNYQPEISLNQSIQDLSDSLEELPDTFDVIKTDLSLASKDFDLVSKTLDQLSVNLTQYNENLVDARDVIFNYIEQAKFYQLSLPVLLKNFNKWLTIITMVLGVFFVWTSLVNGLILYFTLKRTHPFQSVSLNLPMNPNNEKSNNQISINIKE